MVEAPAFRVPNPWLIRLAAGVAMALAALSAAHAASTRSPFTLALARSPLALPAQVALSEGYFAAEGLNVRVLECPNGRRCLNHLLAGEADLATVADTPLVFASFEHSNFVVLATMSISTSSIKLVTRASRVSRASQLAGRRVGVQRYTSAHYYLDSFVLFNGMDPKAVEVVPLPVEDLVASLEEGSVDALAVFEPLAHQAVLRLQGDGLVLPNPGVYLQTFNLVAQRQHVGVRQTDLVALMRALQRARTFIQAHPQAARALLARWLGLDAAAVDSIWQTHRWVLSLDQSLIKTLEGGARWALREGHVQGAGVPNYLGFIDPSPLQALNPDAVGVAH